MLRPVGCWLVGLFFGWLIGWLLVCCMFHGCFRRQMPAGRGCEKKR